MSVVIRQPGLAQGRIPQGHSLTITLIDEDTTGELVETRLVYAEARNSEMGEFIGSVLYGEDGPAEVTGEWPAWAESVMKTRLFKAQQL